MSVIIPEKQIKNAVVNMPWDADRYFETSNGGFVGAIAQYDTGEGNGVLPVFFHGNTAVIMLDENDDGIDAPGINSILKTIVADLGEDFEWEDVAEPYMELDEDQAADIGLSDEDWQDIQARLADLSNYFEESLEDM